VYLGWVEILKTYGKLDDGFGYSKIPHRINCTFQGIGKDTPEHMKDSRE